MYIYIINIQMKRIQRLEFDTGSTSLQRREAGGQLTEPFGREFTAILPPAGGHIKDDLSKLEQNRIEQNRIEQNRIEQNRIEQNRIEQNRIEQNRIENKRREFNYWLQRLPLSIINRYLYLIIDSNISDWLEE